MGTTQRDLVNARVVNCLVKSAIKNLGTVKTAVLDTRSFKMGVVISAAMELIQQGALVSAKRLLMRATA